MISIAQSLSYAYSELSGISDTPRYDAEILLCYVLKKERAYLIANSNNNVSDDNFNEFKNFIAMRKKAIPVAYIIKEKGFWDFNLYVDENVLVPRPDTEILVEKALEELPEKANSFVLELGVGSGAVSLALAKERPFATIIGIDISYNALVVAKKNAHILNVDNVYFCNADWFSSISAKFDVIVSNPPYLKKGDPHLRSDGVVWEPESALIAGNDGLRCYRDILASAKSYLKPNGVLLLEHGCEQKNDILTIAEQNDFEVVKNFKDLSGHDRVIAVRIART